MAEQQNDARRYRLRCPQIMPRLGSMTTVGSVREWHSDEGWGVLDCTETPGGCWAHFSDAAVAGHADFAAGDRVHVEWEAARQDGYSFRAVRFWPYGSEPVTRSAGPGDTGYRSEIRLSFDA